MTNYKVELFAETKDGTVYSKTIELPFVPFVGLLLEAGDSLWDCPRIITVSWFTSSATFECLIEFGLADSAEPDNAALISRGWTPA